MSTTGTIGITEAAAAKLRELQGNDPSRAVLRLYVTGQGCCSYRYGLAFDAASSAEDTVHDLLGLRLAIDPASSQACDGASIDFVDGPAGSGFAVRGPSHGAGCGCGRSRAD